MRIAAVYPFLDYAARGDELRWSIRSLKNITGASVFPVVIGRPPEWYKGARLHVAENGSREQDVQSKLLTACWSDAVTGRFLVISDDTVFSNQIEISDLMTARCRGTGDYSEMDIARISGSSWHERRRKTLEECGKRGWKTKDSSTHWPWTFEKADLLKLFGELSGRVGEFLIEVLYQNRFNPPSKHGSDGFAYVRGNKPLSFWENCLQGNQVVNWSDAAFDAGLRSVLAARFGEPSRWEKSGLDAVQVQKEGETIIIANQSCVHLGEVRRFEYSPYSNQLMPVFQCAKHGECVLQRINKSDTRRCIACSDRSMTSRIVEITRPKRKEAIVADNAGPTTAEMQVAADELFCVHRQAVAYTMQAGSRPCVKRPVTVWNCALHGECSLRPESCLNGKVIGCSACPDLTPLVQLNANKNID